MKITPQHQQVLDNISAAKLTERNAVAAAKAEGNAYTAKLIADAQRETQAKTDTLVSLAVRQYGLPKTRVTKALLTTSPNEVYDRLRRTEATAQVAQAAALPGGAINPDGMAGSLALPVSAEVVHTTRHTVSVLYTGMPELEEGLPTVVTWKRRDNDNKLSMAGATYYQQAMGESAAMPMQGLPVSLWSSRATTEALAPYIGTPAAAETD